MDYNLLKQLKEAGYRSEHQMDMDTGAWCVKCPYDKDRETEGFEEMCYPSSDELIEELEDCVFLDVIKCADGWLASDHYMRGEGSTPKLALINLYLALHKK